MTGAPKELMDYPNWVLWGMPNKQLKAPYDAKTGRPAKANDSTTWATWEQALTGFAQYRPKGFGFELTKESNIICIDIDHCVHDGQPSQQAMEIVTAVDSYTEVSQSGHGLHIFAKGAIPANIGDREGCPIEMYSHGRYIAITGNHLAGTPEGIEWRPNKLLQLYERYADRPVISNQPVKEYTADDAPSTSDIAELLGYIPPQMGYAEWNKICMAVHSAYPNSDGINLILNWSGSAFKEKHPHKVMEAKFKSYDSGGAVGIGTLYHYAKQHGWQPPAKQPPPQSVTLTHDELQQRLDTAFYEGFRAGLSLGRKLWANEGINAGELDYFQLGYDENHAALTVPYFDFEGELINVEYRNGSVSYETNNTPFFVASQGVTSAPFGIVTSQSIKAMKTYTTIASASIKAGIGEPLVMGLPEERLTDSNLLDMVDCQDVYVVAGEDEDMSARGLGQLRGRVKFVRTPWPIEQMVKQMPIQNMLWVLNQGVK